MVRFKEIVESKFCTGCAACVNSCPNDALIMWENEVGHLFPAVDTNKCIECGLCERICPSINEISGKLPNKTFASWAKDINEHNSSTSGGIAAVLSRHMIAKGGIVYGCVCNPGGLIFHQRIDKESELSKLKGSKYVQSEIGNAFRLVNEDLKRGKQVLFIGTPCQIAGLRNSVKKDENLVLVDLVCHGVPPPKASF